MSDTILQVEHLKKYFPAGSGTLHAVDDVSFTLERGKTLGVVGESGCGKSTLGRTILRLIEPTSGSVIFDGEDVSKLGRKAMRKARKDMQIIFQDPFSSVDPRKTVYELITESITTQHLLADRKQIETRVLELMETVGLAERLINTYPHELDGGRRQRIGIARALYNDPKLLILDEATASLDTGTETAIMDAIHALHGKTTMIIIAHRQETIKNCDMVYRVQDKQIVLERDGK